MKKLSTLILLFYCVMTFAQNTYEVFQYDSKYGIVNTETLEEFLAPTYYKWDSYFSDAMVFAVDNDRIFYDYATGTKASFKDTHEDLVFNDRYYKHYIQDNKSVLVPKETKSMIFFDKTFDEIEGSGNGLIVKYNNMFDIYLAPNFKTPKIKNIEATKVYDGVIHRKRTNRTTFVTIFYGKEAVFVYDNDFKLLKKYSEAANYETEMFKVIANEFTKVIDPNYGNATMMVPLSWDLDFKDGYTTITSKANNKSFTIKGHYYSDVFYEKENWIILNDKATSVKHTFKIDFNKEQFILPKKYQEQLQLKFKN